MSIGAVVRANTIPVVVEKYKGEAFHHWETVRGYEVSNKSLIVSDSVSIGESVRSSLPKGEGEK